MLRKSSVQVQDSSGDLIIFKNVSIPWVFYLRRQLCLWGACSEQCKLHFKKSHIMTYIPSIIRPLVKLSSSGGGGRIMNKINLKRFLTWIEADTPPWSWNFPDRVISAGKGAMGGSLCTTVGGWAWQTETQVRVWDFEEIMPPKRDHLTGPSPQASAPEVNLIHSRSYKKLNN